MADILSQDEIDRLLNAASDSSPALSAAGGISSLDDAAISRVSRIVGQVVNAANSSIGTLIARPASVTHAGGEVIPVSDLSGKSGILLHAPFRSGFTGELCFLLDVGSATQLADLILGGEGKAKDAPEDADNDALKEAISQILGNAAPAITSSASMEVGFSPPSAQFLKAGELSKTFTDSKIFAVKAQLSVDGVFNGVLSILCSLDNADRISNALAALEAPQPSNFPESAPMRAAPAQTQAAPVYSSATDVRNIDLILDIEVEVMVRLGNAEMPLREIQKLRPGSIIDLDRDTEALVELVVNDKVIAKGELVVVSSDHFALRVTEIQTPLERIRSLGG